MLDRFGPESAHKLSVVRDRVRAEIRSVLAEKASVTTIQILHAPVFYGAVFVACAELDPGTNAAAVVSACKGAGFTFSDGDAPSNISAAGESLMQLAAPDPDANQAGSWWFWGAADNIRLPAANAVKLADKLAS